MRRFIRRAIIGTAQLLVLPLALWWWITGKKAQVFGSCFDLIAWLPGTTGSILRVALLKWMARRCDEQVRVEMGTF
jgi:hypothetical protein